MSDSLDVVLDIRQVEVDRLSGIHTVELSSPFRAFQDFPYTVTATLPDAMLVYLRAGQKFRVRIEAVEG